MLYTPHALHDYYAFLYTKRGTDSLSYSKMQASLTNKVGDTLLWMGIMGRIGSRYTAEKWRFQ